MSSIYKKKNKRSTSYYLSYRHTEYSRDGRLTDKQKSIHAGKTQAEANAFQREFDRQYKNNKESFNKNESILFSLYLVQDFLPWAKIRKSAKTFGMNEYHLKLILDFFGEVTLDQINVVMIEKWIQFRKRTVSNRTVNMGLTILSQSLKKAVQWDYLSRNVMVNVERLKEGPGRLRFFSTEEVNLILSEANIYLVRLIMVGLMTGARHGEILSIKLKHIDLVNNLIHLVNDDDFSTKNRKNRSIPIPPKLYEVLPYYMETWVDSVDMSINERTQEQRIYLFCDRDGNKLQCFRKAYDRLMVRLGIKNGTTIHTMRHTYCSHLAMNGIGLRTIADLAGHFSVRMTERYAHLTSEHKQDAVKQLNY